MPDTLTFTDPPKYAREVGAEKPVESERPDEREQTGRQDSAKLLVALSCPNGGNIANPCGFPGYGQLYTGSYATYRVMRGHPRIAHTRRQVTAPIISNQYTYGVREGTPENWKKLIEDMFPARTIGRWKREAVRALDYGNYGFEKVWTRRDGSFWIDRIKPLAVDGYQICIYDNGDFAGLQYAGPDDVLNRRESVLHTYDAEAGDLYGRSRLENVRYTAWREWLDAATQLQWTCLKIAGKLLIITTPQGEKWRQWAMDAGRAISSVTSNGTIWLPTLAEPNSRTKENIDYAKVQLANIDVKDFGNHAEAIKGFLDRMRAAEEGMSAGYLRSPRTAMESVHGSRADSQQHTDTDTYDVELVDEELIDTFNEQVIDDVLTLRFGERARGAVFLVASKLRDEHRAIDDKIIDGLIKNPETSTPFLSKIDIGAIADRRNIQLAQGEGDWNLDVEPDNDGDETPGDTGNGGGGGASDNGDPETDNESEAGDA